MPVALNDRGLINEYQNLFDTCIIRENKFGLIDSVTDTIIANKERYDTVAIHLSMPWYFIGIIHSMESSSNFEKHLHNGDPLTKRTVHVPVGRPKTGNPPFTWETSAEDALQLQKLDEWKDWSVPGILFQFELYNGMGYRKKGINSPYLWSFSNQYIKGKFSADGFFDRNAVSNQCGAAILLRRLCERQIIQLGELDRLSLIKNSGSEVKFSKKIKNSKALELQHLLNSIGFALRADGIAAEKTSNAFKQVSGKFLQGDPRIK